MREVSDKAGAEHCAVCLLYHGGGCVRFKEIDACLRQLATRFTGTLFLRCRLDRAGSPLIGRLELGDPGQCECRGFAGTGRCRVLPALVCVRDGAVTGSRAFGEDAAGAGLQDFDHAGTTSWLSELEALAVFADDGAAGKGGGDDDDEVNEYCGRAGCTRPFEHTHFAAPRMHTW